MDLETHTPALYERKRGPVPCMQCIKTATALSSTSHAPSLCHQCTALLRSGNSPRLPPSNRGSPRLGSSLPLLHARESNSALERGLGSRSPSSVSREPAKETKQDVVDKIKGYSYQFVDAVNAREFDHPIWSRTSSDLYMSDFDCYAPTSTVANNIHTFQLIVANDPTYHIEVRHIDVIFDSSKRSVKMTKAPKWPRERKPNDPHERGEDAEAQVEDVEVVHAYANQLITGRPAGVAFDCIAVFTYMRKADDWVLVAFNAMRFSGLSV